LAYKESKDNSENEEQETEIPAASTSSTIPSTPTTVPPTSTTPATIPHTSQPVKRMVPLVEQLFTPHPTVTSTSNTSWNYKIPRNPGGDTQRSSDMPPEKRRLASEAPLDDIPVTPCKFGPIIVQDLGLNEYYIHACITFHHLFYPGKALSPEVAHHLNYNLGSECFNSTMIAPLLQNIAYILQNLPPMLSTPLPSKPKVANLIWWDVPKMAQVLRDGMPWLSQVSFLDVNVDSD